MRSKLGKLSSPFAACGQLAVLLVCLLCSWGMEGWRWGGLSLSLSPPTEPGDNINLQQPCREKATVSSPCIHEEEKTGSRQKKRKKEGEVSSLLIRFPSRKNKLFTKFYQIKRRERNATNLSAARSFPPHCCWRECAPRKKKKKKRKKTTWLLKWKEKRRLSGGFRGGVCAENRHSIQQHADQLFLTLKAPRRCPHPDHTISPTHSQQITWLIKSVIFTSSCFHLFGCFCSQNTLY